MDDVSGSTRGTFRALYAYKAYAGKQGALEEVLIEACHAVRNDPGMIGLTLARSTTSEGGYFVFSRWENRLSLSECFILHRDSGLVRRISDQCEVFSLDVFVPNDPPGALSPMPGRVGEVITSRLFLPLPQHVDEARALMEERSRLAWSSPGCLWVQAHVHADRDDCFHVLTGWESRAALDEALRASAMSTDWSIPFGKLRVATLDIMEPVLQIAPDRLMP